MRQNNWVFFVSRRFSRADTAGRSSLTSVLASLGIAFGVMALLVILSVMNGFQMGYIESILEVSSAHIRVTGPEDALSRLRGLPGIRSMAVYTEAQTLIQGSYDSQQGALVRAVDEDIVAEDPGFAKSARVVNGSFDVSAPSSVVIGYELARMLSVNVGDTVRILAAAGDASSDLFPENPELTVTGLFKTGYYAIDSSYAFVSRSTGESLSGHATNAIAGIKLVHPDSDQAFLSRLEREFPEVRAESWRTYNSAFFGALKVEKNMLLILVVLIFVVVTVNIYNSMRKAVYERREEISVLTALGARPKDVQFVFIANGLRIGLVGAAIGLLFGLFLSVRINDVFSAAETAVNALNLFFSSLLEIPSDMNFSLFSPEYFYLDTIPARMLFPEVLFVFLFGVLSAAFAAALASRAITKLKPAEVLRYE